MIKILQHSLLAIGFSAGMSLAACAQPPENAMGQHGPAQEMPPGPPFPPGAHGPMMMPELSPPPLLQGLDLSEAQQDKIFAILLADAPLAREQEKLAHKSGKELHALLEQDQYDESKIKSLAETQARAMAQLMVLHARSMHQILAVLTADQRSRLNAMKDRPPMMPMMHRAD